MRRKGHSGSEELPGEVHDAQEADGEWGGAGSQESGEKHGEGQGERAGHLSKKVGLDKSGLLGRLAWRGLDDKDDGIMGDME